MLDNDLDEQILLLGMKIAGYKENTEVKPILQQLPAVPQHASMATKRPKIGGDIPVACTAELA